MINGGIITKITRTALKINITKDHYDHKHI